MTSIRKAELKDIDAVEQIYNDIHDSEENGAQTIGWIRGVYPVRETAEAALKRGDLFVQENQGQIVGAGIINQIQVDVYALGEWEHDVKDEEVSVLHTLVISPKASGKGYGKAFISFYENYAKEHGCRELRIDTNARNVAARALYKKLGYKEIGIVPTVFNGIPDVQLVLLEKYLADERIKVTSEIELTLRVIGGKWKPLILHLLQTQGTQRYMDILRYLESAPKKTLTAQLKELEMDGIIHREVIPIVPVQVEYSVTEHGKTLFPILDAMCAWGYHNADGRYVMTHPTCDSEKKAE